jgi:hypothetical protein
MWYIVSRPARVARRAHHLHIAALYQELADAYQREADRLEEQEDGEDDEEAAVEGDKKDKN